MFSYLRQQPLKVFLNFAANCIIYQHINIYSDE